MSRHHDPGHKNESHDETGEPGTTTILTKKGSRESISKSTDGERRLSSTEVDIEHSSTLASSTSPRIVCEKGQGESLYTPKNSSLPALPKEDCIDEKGTLTTTHLEGASKGHTQQKKEESLHEGGYFLHSLCLYVPRAIRLVYMYPELKRDTVLFGDRIALQVYSSVPLAGASSLTCTIQ